MVEQQLTYNWTVKGVWAALTSHESAGRDSVWVCEREYKLDSFFVEEKENLTHLRTQGT